MKFSVGMGITNKCNLNCPHCYSREENIQDIDKDELQNFIENVPIDSINLGTGESILCDSFFDIIELIHKKNIKLSLTTNGFTVSKLKDKHLMYFNDIDFSLDFPIGEHHNSFRKGNISPLIIEGVERCKKNNVECSIATAMMNVNYMFMDKMVELAQKMAVNLRVNIYKPVNTNEFVLTYDEFWEGIRLLFSNSTIISCSEPIVNALIGNKTLDGGSPCGKKSLRIRPDGTIVPCVYLKDSLINMKDFVKLHKSGVALETEMHHDKIPDFCIENCDRYELCKGGCYSRRYYGNGVDKPDEYCFVAKNKKPQIKYKWGEKKDLVHSDYLCTIIVC